MFWISFVIILCLCLFFDMFILLIMCESANELSKPIKLLVSLTQLLRESLSKSAMMKELRTNADYNKIQVEKVAFSFLLEIEQQCNWRSGQQLLELYWSEYCTHCMYHEV
eukprot:TRINITY_DN10161_c0_g1_i3.p2 TRINITY_DN10161_c0_g1~~TRINITY_DN10161_c0_g1_i3.p2  ORF type:complete len:110 (+),score=2.09 TRINITY_DN10161_c0_g1_i3:316-645(+)